MYGNNYYNPMQRVQPTNMFSPTVNTQPYNAITQQTNNSLGLLGKVVDSVDVVKAMDIPLDGSISYFPLTDGSAILTKKLQADGTSVTVVYKPVEEQEEEKPQYATLSEIDSLKDEIKDLKTQIKKLKKGD